MISFIVPLFNHLLHTQAMLASLQASLPPALAHEIILVDDFSTDDTRAWLAALRDPVVRPFLNPGNRGYAATNNSGARVARGEILAFLNNDLLLDPGWLVPMLTVLELPGLKAGIVGNVQHRVADASVDHAGVQLNANGQFEHLQVLPPVAAGYLKVLALTGACVLLRKADFDAVGGFDERFLNGCEDIDLCFKLRALGKSVVLATSSRIGHHVSLSRDRSTLQNERNSQQLFANWRREIKHELSRVWLGLLQAGPQVWSQHLSGTLSAGFLASPIAAARTLAEAMLLREEFRWARDLGQADPNAVLPRQCRASGGLRRLPQSHTWLLEGAAEFSWPDLRSARNFCVCGRVPEAVAPGDLEVTISVNGIHEQVFALGPGRQVNVVMVDPLLLQGVVNRFVVRVHWSVDARPRVGESQATLIITQLVVDDRVVLDF
jgi:GT2 family glycosyltransferase